jgi:hypothetical protein
MEECVRATVFESRGVRFESRLMIMQYVPTT